MIRSGIDALDARLGGGLLEGRYYIIGGSPGAGKTSACFQFLIEGLDRGERCALLTQENPSDLIDQAHFLGYDFRLAAERGDLIVAQYRLDFAHNYSRVANPEVLAREFIDLVHDGTTPARLVVDTILPFADVGAGAHHAANALLHIMEHLRPTALFTVPGDVGDQYYTRLYDSVLSGAGGIFHLTTAKDGVRELALRKVRQGGADWAPLRMVLKPGVGLVSMGDMPQRSMRAHTRPESPSAVPQETAASPAAEAQPEFVPGERILVIDPRNQLPRELAAAMEHVYKVEVRPGLTPDAEPPADTGAVIVLLDAQEPEYALDLMRMLRQQEWPHGAMILVTGEGFRSATRVRGMRAGADEVMEYTDSPKEVMDRLEIARQRGHHQLPTASRDLLLVQPTDESGAPLPVDEAELARAVQRHVDGSDHPFFGLVLIRPAQGGQAQAWRAFSSSLRLADGDLLAECADGRLALYLHDISRKRAQDLINRIRTENPELKVAEETICAYPMDATAITRWIQRASQAQEQRATA